MAAGTHSQHDVSGYDALVLRIGAGISVLASLIVIGSWLYFRREMPFLSRKIVMYMSVVNAASAGLLFVTSFLHGAALPATTCLALSSVWQFLVLSSLAWATCYLAHIYMLTVRKVVVPKSNEWYYATVSLFIPAACALAIVSEQLMNDPAHPAPAIGICGDEYVEKPASAAIAVLSFEGPVMLVWLVVVVMVGVIWCGAGNSKYCADLRRRLALQLVAQCLVATPFLLHILESYGHVQRTPATAVVIAALLPVQGLVCSIAYGLDKHSWRRFRDGCLPCCRPRGFGVSPSFSHPIDRLSYRPSLDAEPLIHKSAPGAMSGTWSQDSSASQVAGEAERKSERDVPDAATASAFTRQGSCSKGAIWQSWPTRGSSPGTMYASSRQTTVGDATVATNATAGVSEAHNSGSRAAGRPAGAGAAIASLAANASAGAWQQPSPSPIHQKQRRELPTEATAAAAAENV